MEILIKRRKRERKHMQSSIRLQHQEPHQSPAVQKEGLQAFYPSDLKTVSTVTLVLLSFKHVMERENECKRRDTFDLIGHICHWSKKNNPSNSTG